MVKNTANATGRSARSPRSGTQIMADQSVQTDNDDAGNIRSHITETQATEYMLACAATMQHATLQFVCSSAVLYIVTVYAQGRGTKGYDEVTKHLTSVVAEKDVKKSMAYDILAQGRKLSAKLVEWHKGGSIVRDICNAESAEAATLALLAYLRADKAVSSFNTLKQAIDAEKPWTPAAAKEAADIAAKAKTPQALATKARAENKSAIDKIAERPSLLESALVRVLKTDENAVLHSLVATLDRIGSVTILETIINKAQERLDVVKAMPSLPAMQGNRLQATQSVN